MIGTVPPSTLQAAPVTYDARSEQRNTITAAISSGSARRPRGRPAADPGEHSVALALLIGEAALAEPGLGPGRAGRDRVAADPVGRVASATRREYDSSPAFITEYSGSVRDGRLRRGRRDVDDRAATLLAHHRQRRASRSHRGHQVELERRLPVGVGELVEPADRRARRRC